MVKVVVAATLAASVVVACGSSGPTSFGGNPSSSGGGGSGSGSSTGGGGNGSSSGTLGGGGGDAGSNCGPDSPDAQGCACSSGQTRACYTGPASTRGVSPCHDGTQTCASTEFGTFGPCTGETLPNAPGACGGAPPKTDAGGDCTPSTCASVHAQCGYVSDGCGGTINCGSCAGGATCGRSDNGQENSCVTPLCQNQSVNTEPEILVAYQPAAGQSVSQNGQIKVWVNDECAPKIAPGEQVDSSTGAITVPGSQNAQAPDGYLWEPALYIAPQTAENGGTPHFPTAIKGDYENDPNCLCSFICAQPPPAPPIDPPPAGSQTTEPYTAEFIWDVSSLNLPPGTYTAEFVIHDGDLDRGVGCVVIIIGA